MSDELRDLNNRFHEHFGVVKANTDIPLVGMSPADRLRVRHAENMALEFAQAIVTRLLDGDSDDQLVQQASRVVADLDEVPILWMGTRRMLSDRQEVRRSEERSLERSDEPGLVAAEETYRSAHAERGALLSTMVKDPPCYEHCRYLGGYRHLSSPIDRAVWWIDSGMETVCIGAGTFDYAVSTAAAMPIPWVWINALKIEAPDEAKRRVTVPRAAAVGVFALAVKKRFKQAVVVLETKYDDVFFIVEGYDPVELRAQLQGWQRYFELSAWIRDYRPPERERSAPVPAVDPINQIRRLAELHASGLVTDEEFAQKRVDLLKRV
jgi:Short C-terminal domain